MTDFLLIQRKIKFLCMGLANIIATRYFFNKNYCNEIDRVAVVVGEIPELMHNKGLNKMIAAAFQTKFAD